MTHQLAGEYFDGRNARPLPGTLQIADDGSLHCVGAELSARHISELIIPDRLGNTPISLRFPDGTCFVSHDNDGVDALRQTFFPAQQQRWLLRLERSWPVAVAMVLLLMLGGWWSFERGLPALATKVAHALPAAALGQLGEETLLALDRTVFAPSELLPHEQERLERVFAQVAEAADTSGDLPMSVQLLSRRGDGVGANAFALPNGTVVVTDELMALAETDDELAGVLAHELGHLAQRHSIRQVLQGAGIAMALFTLTGDMGTASTVLAGLPTAMANARYSREFELEADRYSAQLLTELGLPLDGFGRLLERLVESHGADEDAMPLLASHPGLDERRNRYTANPSR